MSNQQPQNIPFLQLGKKLKSLRESLQETLAEVSGAVEIDTELLEHIERGKERPSEDILLLLMNHFNVKETDANKLLELAGYPKPGSAEPKVDIDELQKHIMMLVPMDTRIVYTDTVQVSVNNYGVILNFLQGASQQTNPSAVARVGMSKEHAQSIITLLQEALEQADRQKTPRALPAPKQKTDKKKSDN